MPQITARQIPRHRNIAILASIALVIGVLAIVPSRAVEYRGLTQIVGLGSPQMVSALALDTAANRMGGANISRIEGQDRYASAATAARAFEPGGSVIVTTGEVFADALVASPLALALEAPMLLTAPDHLPAATADAISRLAPRQVIIVGGYEAVHLPVEDQIAQASPGTVRRVDGPNRWSTAAKMSNVTHPVGATRVYVSNGGEWTDGLPAALAAAAVDAPMLFVRQGEVPSETREALARLAPEEIVVIGNAASVSIGVEDQLRTVASLVRRVGGEGRWETAAAIAEDTWPDGAEMAFVASSQTFQDALVVAPLMARRANLRQPAFATYGTVLAEEPEGEFAGLLSAADTGVAARPEVPGGPLLLADEEGSLPPRAVHILTVLDEKKERTPKPTPTPTDGPTTDPVPVPTGSPGPQPTGIPSPTNGPVPPTPPTPPTPGPQPTSNPNPQPTSNPNPQPSPTGPSCPGDPACPPIPRPTTGSYDAVDDSTTVNEDSGATTVDVLANDTAGAQVTGVTQPSQGTTSITGGGTAISYTPTANACNGGTPPDAFTYTVTGGDTAQVRVSITCVPDSPIAVDDAMTVDAGVDTDLQVLANDYDPDGPNETFTVALASDPANGTVVIGNGGAHVTYTPDADYCNDGVTTDTFVYELHPGASTARVDVTVTCGGQPAVAVDDSYTIDEDTPTNFIVTANDTDAENDPFVVTAVSNPPKGTATIGADPASVDYTPDANACGPDSFTYTITGGDTATVSVSVTCVDDAAVAEDDTFSVPENAVATRLEVLENDSDVEGDGFVVTGFTQPANGTVTDAASSGAVRYQPDPNYCNSDTGVADTFTYTVTGGDTATVEVTVTCGGGINPSAGNDNATVTEDAPATTVDVLANDADVDPDDRITSVTQPANGTVAIAGNGRSLTYKPVLHYCNTSGGEPKDSFTYTVTGGSTGNVLMTVTCVDDAAVAVDDPGTGQEAGFILAQDAAVTSLDVLANDSDVEGDPFAVAAVTNPPSGTASVGAGGADVSYQPDPGFCGSDSFTYTITGGATADVTVTVTCANGSATAVPDSATLTEDAPATTIDVLANDTAGSGALSVDSATQAANGTVVVAGDGLSLTYQPDADYCNQGGARDTFSYTLAGGSTTTVRVTVTCVEDPAVANDDTVTVQEDANAQTLTVLANDTDADGGAFVVTAITTPSPNGTVVIAQDGLSVTYTPTADHCTQGGPDATGVADTFTYEVTDGDTAVVTVNVTCVDDPAQATDDGALVDEDSGVTTISVLANDSDPDGGDVDIQSVTQPAQGTAVLAANVVTYEPDANACNDAAPTDDFTYTLVGGSTGTVRVTVACLPDAPDAIDDAVIASELGVSAWDVTSNDIDVDGDDIEITAIDTSSLELLSSATIGLTRDTIAYTPSPLFLALPAGQSAVETLTYTVDDGTGLTDTATVTITVQGLNGLPVAVADVVAEQPNNTDPITIDVLANDIDPDVGIPALNIAGDVLTVSAVGTTPKGTVDIVNNQVVFTPDPSAICGLIELPPVGSTTFSYTMVDGQGGISTSVVTIPFNCALINLNL